MAVSHFERLVEKAMTELGNAALEAPLGDSHAVAVLKGRAIGLKQSLELYRQATRTDDEAAL
jgi:hypothetical protein